MARFDGGWIKVHRGLLDHWISKDVYAFSIFLKLLLWANIKPSKYPSGGEIKTLERGQLITSLHDIANSFEVDGPSHMTVDRKLKLFVNEGAIVQNVLNTGRIITICNYNNYQDYDDQGVKRLLNQSETAVKPKLNQSYISEELKELKKVRKNILPTASPSVDDKPQGSVLWDRYSELYEKRHTVKPARSAKENSLCAQIIKQIGLEDALKTVEFYLASDQHAMYRHELPYFKQHIQRLRTDALSSKTASLIEKYGLKAL